MIDKYINFNNIISFNISINIINYSIDYVYYIKYTMNNIKKYKKITIKFSKIILLIYCDILFEMYSHFIGIDQRIRYKLYLILIVMKLLLIKYYIVIINILL